MIPAADHALLHEQEALCLAALDLELAASGGRQSHEAARLYHALGQARYLLARLGGPLGDAQRRAFVRGVELLRAQVARAGDAPRVQGGAPLA